MNAPQMSPSEVANRIDHTKTKLRLEWYESQIRTRAKSLAAIFVELRSDPMQPWRASGHELYEDYCREVWGMSPRRQQQIAAGETVKALLAADAPDLATLAKDMPEGQARALVTIPPEKRAEVIREAIKQPGKLTAAKIKQAKARVIDPKTGAPEPEPQAPVCCPTCNRPLP